MVDQPVPIIYANPRGGIYALTEDMEMKARISTLAMKVEELEDPFDSCHGRVSGIKKICFLCSSYCRSQATAA